MECTVQCSADDVLVRVAMMTASNAVPLKEDGEAFFCIDLLLIYRTAGGIGDEPSCGSVKRVD